MSGQRAILQTFWHVDPAQPVLVQDERRITRNRIEAFCAQLRLVIRSFAFHETGNINAGPFLRVPPHEFFPFAPGTAAGTRATPVIDNPTIARPGEAPAVTEVISRFARVFLVYAIATKDAGINPGASGSRAV